MLTVLLSICLSRRFGFAPKLYLPLREDGPLWPSVCVIATICDAANGLDGLCLFA